ncbi:putative RDD family membrane protein YckC [Pedobacter sp. UYP30]|uniref:RDD family protein n=1 Tax=Pedobacter sp. UYP30 TaxID=1756400 RepID=UPI00339316CD
MLIYKDKVVDAIAMNPETDKYLIVIKGKPTGPFLFSQLKDLVINPETFVRKPGMDDFKQAHDFPELRTLFGFVQQKTAPQYYASFDLRLLASVIDHFVIFIFYAVLILISFIFIEGKDQRIMVFTAPLALIFIVKLVYGSFVEAGKTQATLGKRLVGIKVTDLAGTKLFLGNSLLRNFSKIISVLPFMFGYFYSFLNKKNQCFHDLIANTLVVKDRLI